MTDKAYAVPLHEQLASVPRDARLIIDDADGMGTRFIPVGRMCHEAAEALRARLAQPEPEPVAWVAYENGEKHGIDFDEDEIAKLPVGTMLYTAPPQREWQYRRGDRLLCLETEEYCVIHVAGTNRQWIKFPDSHVGVYTNEQVAEMFELLPKEREWQGLTDEDVKSIVFVERSWADAVRKVEAKLKEKNGF